MSLDTSPRPHSLVTATPAAPSASAAAHFRALLAFETDCWDVHEEVTGQRVAGQAGSTVGTGDLAGSEVVVLDVRSPEGYASGHVPTAVNLPHREIDAAAVAAWPASVTFVVYCSGPHCNAADQAALRLAEQGRPVKKMIGGIEGWKDNGFALEQHDSLEQHGAVEHPGSRTRC